MKREEGRNEPENRGSAVVGPDAPCRSGRGLAVLAQPQGQQDKAQGGVGQRKGPGPLTEGTGAAAAMAPADAMAASMATPSAREDRWGSRLTTDAMFTHAHQAGKKSRTKVPNSAHPGSPWIPNSALSS